MPLFAKPVIVPPALPVPQPGSDQSTALWIAPDGGQWPLTDVDHGWFTLPGVAGLGAAPVQHTVDAHQRGGVRIIHTQPLQRFITWPLYVEGATHGEFLARWRALAVAFTQTSRRGPGLLRISRPDGTAREIEAHYEAGFAEQVGQGLVVATPVLTLLCEDPYWVDTNTIQVLREFSTAQDYYSPYISVSSGQVLGATTITNSGDVEAWPTWAVRGPMSSLEAINHTTGEAFTLTADLLDDTETATIVTDPPQVRGPNGENWVGNLDWPDAVLWALQPGLNEVEFQVLGAAAGTRVELVYRLRHETA